VWNVYVCRKENGQERRSPFYDHAVPTHTAVETLEHVFTSHPALGEMNTRSWVELERVA
jgi:hypothetical protein